MHTSFILTLKDKIDEEEFPFLLDSDTNIPLLLQEFEDINDPNIREYRDYLVYYMLLNYSEEDILKYLTLDDLYRIYCESSKDKYKKYFNYLKQKIEESVSHINIPIITSVFYNVPKLCSKFVYNLDDIPIKYIMNFIKGEFISLNPKIEFTLKLKPKKILNYLDIKISKPIIVKVQISYVNHDLYCKIEGGTDIVQKTIKEKLQNGYKKTKRIMASYDIRVLDEALNFLKEVKL